MNKLLVILLIIKLNAHNNILNSKLVLNVFSKDSSELYVMRKRWRRYLQKYFLVKLCFYYNCNTYT